MKRYQDTIYLITEDGQVWSEQSKRFLKQKINNRGYKNISLFNKGNVLHKLVHRLVAECYIPNPNNYDCINHLDNNPTNNCVENLEWCNRQINIQYSTDQGRRSKGEDRHSAKLTEQQVLEIRRKYDTKESTIKMLSIEYSICFSVIYRIVVRSLWKHI